MHVFAADDPLPSHLRVSISAALHSVATACKVASPLAEESFDSAWAPIGKKARPRLDIVTEQLRVLSDPSYHARVARLRSFFETLDRGLSRLESAPPEEVPDAAVRLQREVNAVLDWLKLPAVQG